MTYLGVDLSNYQGDLPETGLEHLDFAYVLATDGSDFKNPDAPQQVAALRKQGVRVGLYHYVTTDNTLDQENNFYYMATALGGTDLPLALDIETGGGSPQEWQALAARVADFALAIEGWSLTARHPRTILYANEDYYVNLPGFPWGRWVWYARPGVSSPDRPCLVWQSGERPVSGVPGEVDADQFMGSEAQWALFTQEAPSPTPAPPKPPVQPPLTPQESLMAVTQAVTYRAGQYDYFMVTGGRLIHHWHAALGWAQEDVCNVLDLKDLAPTLTGQPQVAVLGGVCIVTAEDSTGKSWCFQQGATGGWEFYDG